MTIKRMLAMFTEKDDVYKFQLFIEEVEENEKEKADEFANRSTYINPRVLRLDYQPKPKNVTFWIPNEYHCPV